MQKTCRTWVVVVCLIGVAGLSSPGYAEEPESSGPRAGIGLDLGIGNTSPAGGLGALGGLGAGLAPPALGSGVRVPIDLGGGWYLEPALSGSFSESERTSADGQGAGGSQQQGALTTRGWAVDGAIQVRRGWEIGDATIGFSGARVGIGYGRTSVDQVPSGMNEEAVEAQEHSATNYSLGPILGAEHYLSEAFSLGLEVGIVGRIHETSYDNSDRSRTDYSVGPQGAFVMRTYF